MNVTERPRLRAEFAHTHRSAGDQTDRRYYLDRAREADGPVLELGCGTGRIYLPLLGAGVDADGLDRSPAALSVLCEHARADGLDPAVWQGDMTNPATDRMYDLVVCPFNTLQQLLTPDLQAAALSAAFDALAPGGAFVFDVFVPDFELICATYGEWQTTTVEFRGEPHEFRSRARLVDQVRQVVAVEQTVSGPEAAFTDSHRMTLLPRDEVLGLVRRSPFDGWTATGDFTDEQLADGHRTQVWELRKR